MENEETVQSLAQSVLDQFETRTRESTNAEFITFKSSKKSWMQELARTAHFDLLPNDWSYAFIQEMLQTIVDHDDMDMARDSIEASIYNYELTDWLSSNNCRAEFVDRAKAEFGEAEDLMTAIGYGQMLEKQEIFESLLSGLEAQL